MPGDVREHVPPQAPHHNVAQLPWQDARPSSSVPGTILGFASLGYTRRRVNLPREHSKPGESVRSWRDVGESATCRRLRRWLGCPRRYCYCCWRQLRRWARCTPGTTCCQAPASPGEAPQASAAKGRARRRCNHRPHKAEVGFPARGPARKRSMNDQIFVAVAADPAHSLRLLRLLRRAVAQPRARLAHPARC